MRELKNFKIVSLDGRDYFEGVVYCYTNKINGKRYIGQTIKEKERKKQHEVCSKSSSPNHYNKIFYKAVRKYGFENMKYSVLVRVLETSLKLLCLSLNSEEKKYIELYDSKNNGYNATYGGDGTVGRVKTEEEKAKISAKVKAAWLEGRMPDKSGENSSSAIYICQYTLNGEFIQKFKSSKTGEKLTGVPAKWILHCISGSTRKTAGGFIFTREKDQSPAPFVNKCAKKPVYMFNMEGEFLDLFPSCYEAGLNTNMDHSAIRRACIGEYNNHKEFRWSYNSFPNPIKENIHPNPMQGKHHSEETKEKIRLMFTGKTYEDGRVDTVSICKYDILGNFIKKYPSVSCACKDNGLTRGKFDILYKNPVRTNIIKGYVWSFEEKDKVDVINIKKITKAKAISQYTKKLVHVRDWESATEAHNNLNISRGDITSCCKGKLNSAGGFVWVFQGECPEYTASESNTSKIVEQYTLDNIFIREFESVREAARFIKCGNSNISNCCKGARSQSHGYIWKFKI